MVGRITSGVFKIIIGFDLGFNPIIIGDWDDSIKESGDSGSGMLLRLRKLKELNRDGIG